LLLSTKQHRRLQSKGTAAQTKARDSKIKRSQAMVSKEWEAGATPDMRRRLDQPSCSHDQQGYIERCNQLVLLQLRCCTAPLAQRPVTTGPYEWH
jgi:hypothetical protein